MAGLDIINYLNKKDKFKGSLAAKAHLPQPPDGAPIIRGDAGSPPKKKRAGNTSVEGSKSKIELCTKVLDTPYPTMILLVISHMILLVPNQA